MIVLKNIIYNINSNAIKQIDNAQIKEKHVIQNTSSNNIKIIKG